MNIKTTKEIETGIYNYNEKWVKVEDLKAYLDSRIDRYISYCIKHHKDSEILYEGGNMKTYEDMREYVLNSLFKDANLYGW